MGLIINGTPPVSVRTIKDGATATHSILEATKNGNTVKYWGRPVSLYIQESNPDITTVTVNRISSPNQQAPLGNVTDGSLVYYGDVLEISATVTDSSYEIESFKVDNVNWTSGQQITVTQWLPIYVIVNLKESASWRTLWSGSYNSGYVSQTAGTIQTVNAYDKVGVTVEETVNPYPVRLTGRLIVGDGVKQFTELEIPNVNDTPSSVSITVSGDTYILDEVFASETVTLTMVQSAMGSSLSMAFKNTTGEIAYQYYITKIEQYY